MRVAVMGPEHGEFGCPCRDWVALTLSETGVLCGFQQTSLKVSALHCKSTTLGAVLSTDCRSVALKQRGQRRLYNQKSEQ